MYLVVCSQSSTCSVLSMADFDFRTWQTMANRVVTTGTLRWVTVHTGTPSMWSFANVLSPRWVCNDYQYAISLKIVFVLKTLDIHFLCLGDWESASGDRYLALMDLREEPEARPKYRCGVSRGITANKTQNTWNPWWPLVSIETRWPPHTTQPAPPLSISFNYFTSSKSITRSIDCC